MIVYLIIFLSLKDGQNAVTDFIDTSDYKIHPDLAVGDRMAIEYSEPTFLDQGATYIRVTLLIKSDYFRHYYLMFTIERLKISKDFT